MSLQELYDCVKKIDEKASQAASTVGSLSLKDGGVTYSLKKASTDESDILSDSGTQAKLGAVLANMTETDEK